MTTLTCTQPFTYHIDHLALSEQSPMVASFNSLTPSAYKDGSYRLRRYSVFHYDKLAKMVSKQPHEAFVQDDSLNKFQGNVARDYDDLTDATIADAEFIAMLDAFATTANLPDVSKIAIHQMRIIAKDRDANAVATPEGIHQDGFDYIGVFTTRRHNVAGGELYVWQDKTDAVPIATLDPKAGDYCVLNDKQLWHSASDVAPAQAGQGFWDLFVLTAHDQPAVVS